MLLDDLKGAVRGQIRDVKHGHCIEAMARGLGWRTYASMRADLAEGGVLRAVNDEAFRLFLADRGYPDIPQGRLEAALRSLADRANAGRVAPMCEHTGTGEEP